MDSSFEQTLVDVWHQVLVENAEQNPDTKSRWAQMARSGKKVMQFLSGGRYVANVVDAKVTLYGRGGSVG